MAVKPAAGRAGAGIVELRRRPLEPDDLFNALDGRDIIVLGRRWRVEIYSIRDRGGVRWVQLALSGTPNHLLAVRTTVGDSSQAIIRALSVWLINPAVRTEVVPVASSAQLRLTTKSHQDNAALRHADHCHPGR